MLMQPTLALHTVPLDATLVPSVLTAPTAPSDKISPHVPAKPFATKTDHYRSLTTVTANKPLGGLQS